MPKQKLEAENAAVAYMNSCQEKLNSKPRYVALRTVWTLIPSPLRIQQAVKAAEPESQLRS